MDGYISGEDTFGSTEVMRLLETGVTLALGLESGVTENVLEGDTGAYSVGDMVGE